MRKGANHLRDNPLRGVVPHKADRLPGVGRDCAAIAVVQRDPDLASRWDFVYRLGVGIPDFVQPRKVDARPFDVVDEPAAEVAEPVPIGCRDQEMTVGIRVTAE